MAQNCRMVIAIEWIAAAQGLEFHKPLQTAAPLQSAVAVLRSVVPSFERDRFFAPEMEKAAALLAGNTLSALVTEPVGASYQ